MVKRRRDEKKRIAEMSPDQKAAEKSATEQLRELAKKELDEKKKKCGALLEKFINDLADLGFELDAGTQTFGSGEVRPIYRFLPKK